MEIPYLSPSALKQLDTCEARFVAMRGGDADFDEEKGEPALAGNLAHMAAKFWFGPKYRDKSTSPDVAFQMAIEECSKPAWPGANPDLPKTPEGLQMARQFFESIIAYYNRDSIKVVFAERKYKGELENGVPVSLVIDMAIDRGNGVLEIVDFKTGFITMTDEDMRTEHQVLINLLAVTRDPGLSEYPTKQFVYFWVRAGYPSGEVKFVGSQLTDYELWLAYRYQYALNLKEPSESLNPFCGSCGRRFKCTKFRELITDAFGKIAPVTEDEVKNMTQGEVMEGIMKLNAQMKILDSSNDMLKHYLLAQMSRQQTDLITTDKFKASMRTMVRENYDVDTVYEICQKHGINFYGLVNVVKTRADEAFAGNLVAQAQLAAEAAQAKKSRPFLVVSKVADKKPKKSKE